MLIQETDQRDLLVYAFRYVLGRQTYATATMQDVLRISWLQLERENRVLFKREIREARDRRRLGDERIDAPRLLRLFV